MRVSSRPDKRFASRRDRYDPGSQPESDRRCRYNPGSHPETGHDGGGDSEDDFERHKRRRSKRFYIGVFKPSISREKLSHYVTRNVLPG